MFPEVQQRLRDQLQRRGRITRPQGQDRIFFFKQERKSVHIWDLSVEELYVLPPLPVLHEPVAMAEEATESPLGLKSRDRIALSPASEQVNL